MCNAGAMSHALRGRTPLHKPRPVEEGSNKQTEDKETTRELLGISVDSYCSQDFRPALSGLSDWRADHGEGGGEALSGESLPQPNQFGPSTPGLGPILAPA